LISVYAGTKVRLSGSFRNLGGTLVAPTAVVLTVQRPDGTDDTPSTTTGTTGIYYADYDTSGLATGLYCYRFAGTGALVAADEDWFEVLISGV
jgi:hypothetical protein